MYRWISLGLVAGALLRAAPVPITGQPVPGLESFDSAMQAILQKYNVPGAALAISYDGRLVLAHGYGYGDLEALLPVQPDSLFRFASITKPITAAAILQLIARGKLSFDAKAFQILNHLTPPLGTTPDARLFDVTIRNLLEHRGGWDRDVTFDPVFMPFTAAAALGIPPPAGPTDIVRWMMGQPLQFTPGSKWVYSNFGYCVLGRVIEKITGKSVEEYIRTELLAPMLISRMRLGKSLRADHFPDEVAYYDTPPSQVPYSIFMDDHDASGGWVGSAIDLVRFADTMNGQLNPAGFQRPPANFAGYVYTPPPGCCWAWGHTGSLPGTNALLRLHNGYLFNGRVTWAVLFNTRVGNDVLLDEAGDPFLQLAKSVVSWPSHDLFPQYGGSTSGCQPTTSTPSTVRAQGGVVSFNVQVPAGCGWSARTDANWITGLSPAAGVGTGPVTLSVEPNNASAGRTGTVLISGISVTIQQDGNSAGNAAAGPFRFVAVTPCRLMDTRPGQGKTGSFGPPALESGQTREVPTPAGNCGITANAAAYSLNVTVVPWGPLGYLALWPKGQSRPLVSTLNSPQGRIVANAAIVPAGVNGSIQVFVTDKTDVIMDINGYFVPY